MHCMRGRHGQGTRVSPDSRWWVCSAYRLHGARTTAEGGLLLGVEKSARLASVEEVNLYSDALPHSALPWRGRRAWPARRHRGVLVNGGGDAASCGWLLARLLASSTAGAWSVERSLSAVFARGRPSRDFSQTRFLR